MKLLDKRAIEVLEKISGFCPDEILEDSRNKQDINYLLQEHDDLLTKELIKLDHIIKVDCEDTEIKKFGNVIQEFVEILREVLYTKHKIILYPAGSFPLGLKINKIDEFDFVLICNSILNVQTYILDHSIAIDETEILQWLELLEEFILQFLEMDVPCKTSLSILYKRTRSGLNIKLTWRCPSNCKHSVSIDVAFSQKSTKTVVEYLKREEKISKLQISPFKDAIAENKNIYWTLGCERFETNIFDRNLFDVCDKISPNIKRCFRLLKFIFHHLGYKRLEFVKYELNNIETEELKPYISSYELKQLVFNEVLNFPSIEDWKNEKIVDRILSILKTLLAHRKPCKEHEAFGHHCSSSNGCNNDDCFQCLLDPCLSFNGYKEDIEWFIMVLQNSKGCNFNEDLITSTMTQNSKVYRIKTKYNNGESLCSKEEQTYFLSLLPEIDIFNNKICNYISKRYRKLTNESIYLDLTFCESVYEIDTVVEILNKDILTPDKINEKLEHVQKIKEQIIMEEKGLNIVRQSCIVNCFSFYSIAKFCSFHLEVKLSEKVEFTENKDINCLQNQSRCFTIKLFTMLNDASEEELDKLNKTGLFEDEENTIPTLTLPCLVDVCKIVKNNSDAICAVDKAIRNYNMALEREKETQEVIPLL